MEMLPDEVLLMVLEELGDAKDILACRLVCKRLAALALHPAVWRYFEVCHSKPYCSCPLLRLAPCLDTISICLPAEGCPQWAFASTRCAAARLWICIKGAAHAGHAAAIVSRQEMLGRLTDVAIEIMSAVAIDVPMLLGMLASTSGLERLSVDVDEGNQLRNTAAPILGRAVVTPSLKDFDCTLSPLTEPFVRFILSEHAATLEEVYFGSHPIPSALAFTSISPLLAGLTNLNKLGSSCLLPGMEALTACKSLSVLELTVHTESINRPAVAGLAKLLRRAEHLREVKLEYNPGVNSVADVGADLVSALATSGRSRVETLLIENYGDSGSDENSPLLQHVVSALPSLSALRLLKFDDNNARKPDALLLAISPDVAPALRTVEVTLFEGCSHSWLHGDTVKTVMAVNPSLHIKFRSLWTRVCKDDGRCQACELGCHAELRVDRDDRTWSHLCLFSHDPLDECSEGHSEDSYGLWIHLPL